MYTAIESQLFTLDDSIRLTLNALGCSGSVLTIVQSTVVNYDTTILLTLADVRCTVANTTKMANWMMCCMVSERSHCNSEVEYMKLVAKLKLLAHAISI